jgi:tetratricopeptide (TPR) repeat protein
MEFNLEAKMHEALSLCKQGDLHQAKQIYLEIIKKFPNNIDALTNLGTIELHIGDIISGIGLLQKSIDFFPHQPNALLNIGNAFLALAEYEKALNSYKKVCLINSLFVDAHYNKGKAFFLLGRNVEALEAYNKAINLDPHLTEAHNNKGTVLNQLGRFEEALVSYNSALRINSNYVEAYYNKGVVLNELGRFEEALVSYDSALRINSNYAEVHNNKGTVLNQLGRFEDALASYDSALRINSDYAEAYYNKGVVLNELGRFEDALASYDSALRINSDYAEAHFNRACLKLEVLDFENSWDDYIWRFKVKSLGIEELRSKKPKWNGSKTTSRLFVWSEQGIGDQILYASMLHDLQKYANRITVAVNKKLVVLFKRSFPEINFIEDHIFFSEENYDEQIAIGDLAGYFRSNLNAFNFNRTQHLLSDECRSQEIQKNLQKDARLTCGISWKSANEKLGNHKSIEFRLFSELLNNKNIQFVNLQYGETGEELTWLKKSTSVNLESINDIDLYDDIDGVAAIINACDFIVTISNSVAHLAGALGKETLLLVPYSRGKFWYWSDVDGRSLWYPNIQIFKQSVSSEWSGPIAQVRDWIEKKYVAKN